MHSVVPQTVEGLIEQIRAHTENGQRAVGKHTNGFRLEAALDRSEQAHREAQQRLFTLFTYAPEAIVMLDVETGRFLDANPTAEQLFGLPRDELLQSGPFDLSPSRQPGGDSSTLGEQKIAAALSGRAPIFEWWHCNAQGSRFPCEVHLKKMPWGDRDVILGTILDISVRKRLELSELGRRRMLEVIANELPLQEAFGALVQTIEELLPGMICSFLLLEKETNCLRLAAAPNLPDFYNAAVDGLAIGPLVGSCGAAAFSGRRVIVSDVTKHPNWSGFRQLAEQAGLRACWSEPVISFSGDVLGTFAMYYREPTEPAPVELCALEVAAQLAAFAIEHDRTRSSLRDLNLNLEQRVADKTKHLIESNQQLSAAEQQLRLAAVAFDTRDSILITDRDGKILRVNQSFTKLTGYKPDEAIGKTPGILKSTRHDDGFYRQMWEAIRTNGYWSGELWNRRKDGHEYLQRLTIASVKDAAGETTHYVGSGQDLTEEKLAESDRAAIDAARRVQESLFPAEPPSCGDIDVAGVLYIAEHASGDYYDFISLPDDSLAFLVADVCGHGLAPALLMAQTQAYVHAMAATYDNPGEILTHTNRFLRRIDTNSFVTMVLVHFNPLTHSFVFSCAGHPGYWLRSSGAVVRLHEAVPPLGILDEQIYPNSASTILESGDIILLPTDGIWESICCDGNFGEQRMLDLVWANRHKSANEIAHLLCRTARDFDASAKDDITAVVVKRV